MMRVQAARRRGPSVAFFSRLALAGLAFLCLLGEKAPALASPVVITPFLGKPTQWNCGSLVLDPSNVVGFFSMPEDGQTVSVRVLYRNRSGSNPRGTLALRMMRDDAEALRGEVDAMSRGLRSRPIRFHSRILKDGSCEVDQVAG